MSNDIKPCPFCGSKQQHLINVKGPYIECKDCGCQLPVNTQYMNVAIEKWNVRSYSEKTAQHEMTYDEAVEAIPPGVYRHFKGGIYRVQKIALDTETGKPIVVYSDRDELKTYCRSVENFTEEVTRKRFERMEAQS